MTQDQRRPSGAVRGAAGHFSRTVYSDGLPQHGQWRLRWPQSANVGRWLRVRDLNLWRNAGSGANRTRSTPTPTPRGRAPESVNHELIFRQISPLGGPATQSMTSFVARTKRGHRCQIRMTLPASRCFGSVSFPCLWWVPVCWAEVPCCCYRRCPQHFTDFHKHQETAKKPPMARWSKV
jgi:hypothetical protein